MSLTAAQQTDVYKFLGATPMWRQINPAIRNALLALENFADVNLEASIAGELTALNAVDAQIINANRRQKFKQVEDVHFRGPEELAALRSQGRMHVSRLAGLLGVSVVNNVFGGGGAVTGAVMKHG